MSDARFIKLCYYVLKQELAVPDIHSKVKFSQKLREKKII